MNAAATETFPPPLAPPAPPFTSALEAVELELTLGQKETDAERMEDVIRETVESVGGVVLFQFRLGEGETGRWMAAVAFADDETREIAVIDLPLSGGRATVSPATESDLPIASIASAYAGLAECWSKAA